MFVIEPTLGRMMEEAELEAHADAWIPRDDVGKDMDTQLRYLLVMLTTGPVLQIIRQQPSGVQDFRYLARRYNPRTQASSLAKVQDTMHFDRGHEPATVTDRLVACDRMVKEYETSSGEELGTQVRCAVLLERVPSGLRTYLLHTSGSCPDCPVMRQTVENCSVARRS